MDARTRHLGHLGGIMELLLCLASIIIAVCITEIIHAKRRIKKLERRENEKKVEQILVHKKNKKKKNLSGADSR